MAFSLKLKHEICFLFSHKDEVFTKVLTILTFLTLIFYFFGSMTYNINKVIHLLDWKIQLKKKVQQIARCTASITQSYFLYTSYLHTIYNNELCTPKYQIMSSVRDDIVTFV